MEMEASRYMSLGFRRVAQAGAMLVHLQHIVIDKALHLDGGEEKLQD